MEWDESMKATGRDVGCKTRDGEGTDGDDGNKRKLTSLEMG